MDLFIQVLAVIGAFATTVTICLAAQWLYVRGRDVLDARRIASALKDENDNLRRQLEGSQANMKSFKDALIAKNKGCSCEPITTGSYRDEDPTRLSSAKPSTSIVGTYGTGPR